MSPTSVLPGHARKHIMRLLDEYRPMRIREQNKIISHFLEEPSEKSWRVVKRSPDDLSRRNKMRVIEHDWFQKLLPEKKQQVLDEMCDLIQQKLYRPGSQMPIFFKYITGKLDNLVYQKAGIKPPENIWSCAYHVAVAVDVGNALGLRAGTINTRGHHAATLSLPGLKTRVIDAYDKDIRSLSEWRSKNPGPYNYMSGNDLAHAGVFNLLGYIAIIRKDYANAEKAIRHAISLNPNIPDFYAHLGLALEYQHKYEEAEALLRKVVSMDPTSPWYHHNLAIVLEAQGKIDEADRHRTIRDRLNKTTTPGREKIVDGRGKIVESQ